MATVEDAIASTSKQDGAQRSGSNYSAEKPTPPEGFRMITEGAAHIIFPAENEVFYNMAQVFNRDLSVMVARLFLADKHEADKKKVAAKLARREAAIAAGKKMHNDGPSPPGLRVLDALSASGLRAIRYAKEIPGLTHVLANDLLPEAVAAIKRNLEFNKLDPALVHTCEGDAAMTCMLHRTKELQFDLVDLDPFGSPAMFLDSAVQTVSEGGMLAVTCTDMAVLCGNHSEACFGKYGGMPLRGKHCHEFALRLVLACLSAHAARYKRYITPIVSCSMDFYIRVFVRVNTGAEKVKYVSSKLSTAFQCVNCGSCQLQPLGKVHRKSERSVKFLPSVAHLSPASSGDVLGCRFCKSRLHMGGPIWNGPIHDSEFLAKAIAHLKTDGTKLYAASPKLIGMLTAMSQELPDVPLFQNLHSMAKVMRCISPDLQSMRSALLNAGYRVSQSHTDPLAIKTDAPQEFVWDVLKAWMETHPVKELAEGKVTPGKLIAALPATAKVDFTFNRSHLAKQNVPRFLPNPEENWGPKAIPGKKRKRDKPEEGGAGEGVAASSPEPAEKV